MEKKWLHIQLLGSDPWVLPIRGAIYQAVLEGRMSEPGKKFGELCLNVSLRMSLLPRIAMRLEKAWASLSTAIGKRKGWHEFTTSKPGYAFPWNHDSILDLVVDIDSLLFEIGSCTELMDAILKRAHRDTGTPPRNAGKLDLTRDILQREGKDVTWLDQLADLRNLFIHQATPYPAVDLSSTVPELIILRENVVRVDDDSKFVRLSELKTMVGGFLESKDTLQKHVIALYEGCIIGGSINEKRPRVRPDPTKVIIDEYVLKSDR